MDVATVIGLLTGWGLLLWAIFLGGNLGMFFNVPSLIIVLGGTGATLFMRFRMSELNETISVFLHAFKPMRGRVDESILQITEMANLARKDGILGLERFRTTNPFLQRAVNHVVDGADHDFLESVLSKELEFMIKRHSKGIEIFEHIGETAPAMGMIGTLVGLIQMLAHMEDPAAVGQGLAVAFLTTLYGITIAHLFAFPIAQKLGNYSDEEQITRRVIIDGVIGIQRGVNPRMLQESLKACLPPKLRGKK